MYIHMYTCCVYVCIHIVYTYKIKRHIYIHIVYICMYKCIYICIHVVNMYVYILTTYAARPYLPASYQQTQC